MITARAAQSPEYYLSPDCPTTDGKLEARWGGKGSKILGLPDEFGTLSFLRLAKGLNPETGSQLTARLSSNRKDAIDLCVTVPKEVSLLIEVAQDQRVKEALWKANEYVIREWEKKTCVRVRKGGQQTDRVSDNITVASFYHGTGRPVEDRGGHPDPNSHIHNYVTNISLDRQEGIWKAGKRHHFDTPTIEKGFHDRLAKGLRKAGYDATVEVTRRECRRKDKGLGIFVKRTEIVSSRVVVKGVDEQTVSLFTGRQEEVLAVQRAREAKGQSMTEGYKARGSQMTRQPKSAAPKITTEDLRANWRGRMSTSQSGVLGKLVSKARLTAARSPWLGKLKNHVARLRSFTNLRDAETRQHARTRSDGRSR